MMAVGFCPTSAAASSLLLFTSPAFDEWLQCRRHYGIVQALEVVSVNAVREIFREKCYSLWSAVQQMTRVP